MDWQSALIGLAGVEVNSLSAYPARRGSGRHTHLRCTIIFATGDRKSRASVLTRLLLAFLQSNHAVAMWVQALSATRGHSPPQCRGGQNTASGAVRLLGAGKECSSPHLFQPSWTTSAKSKHENLSSYFKFGNFTL